MNIRIVEKSKNDINSAAKMIEYISQPYCSKGSPKCASIKSINFLISSPEFSFLEFDLEISTAPSNSNPYLHLVVSWASSEYASAAEIDDLVLVLLQKLKIPTHKAIYCLHVDTENLHIHLLVSRVDPTSRKVVSIENGFIKKAINRIVESIAYEHGWSPEKDGRLTRDKVHVQFDKKSRPNITLPAKLRKILKDAFQKSNNWQQFHAYLAIAGPRFFLSSDKKINCCFNGVIYHESEFSRELSKLKFLKKFKQYEVFSNEPANSVPEKLHASYPRLRSRDYVPIQLRTCHPFCLRTRIATRSILSTHAADGPRKTVFMRRESKCQSNWAEIEKHSSYLENLLGKNSKLFIYCKIGKNPDFRKLEIEEPVKFTLQNFIRKSVQNDRAIELYLPDANYNSVFFSMNDTALENLQTICNKFSKCRVADTNYVMIDFEEIIPGHDISFGNRIRRAAIEIVLGTVSKFDPSARQEPGLPIYDSHQPCSTIEMRSNPNGNELFLRAIKNKAEELIQNNMSIASQPVRSFLQEIRKNLHGKMIHFTRELFLYFYFGKKRYGDRLNIESVLDEFAFIGEDYGYTRLELKRMLYNFDFRINNFYLRPSKDKSKPPEEADLAFEAATEMLTCDIHELKFELDYWVVHLNEVAPKINTPQPQVLPEGSGLKMTQSLE